MAVTRFTLSFSGIGELARSQGIRDDLEARAERVKSSASSWTDDEVYRAALRVVTGVTDRSIARVIADADHALWLETDQGVLGKALDAARGS